MQRNFFPVGHASNGSYSSVLHNNAVRSCATRATYAKSCGQQPKIMSPASNDSSPRKKYVSSLSIISNDKVPEIVILPSIENNIAFTTNLNSASQKIPIVSTPGKKSSTGTARRTKETKPPTKFISCLHTSLSTEWKKDSLEKETSHEENKKLKSSQQVEQNSKVKSVVSTAGKFGLISSVDRKADLSRELDRSEAGTGISSNRQNNKEHKAMDKQTVRVQYPSATGKSFTIKDTVVTADKKLTGMSTNVVASGSEFINSRRAARVRALPKTRFRVKIQKCHHKTLNISDSLYYSEEKNEKTAAMPAKNIVIQNKGTQRSFSVKKN